MNNVNRTWVLAVCLSVAGMLAYAAEQVPLEFDGHASLSYPADPVFELGPEGTIDFWVRAGWTQPLAQDACVVANGDKSTSRYAAYLTGDGQGVVLWDGARSAGAGFNFLDGEAHHVAIATRGHESKFFVDGRWSTPGRSATAMPARCPFTWVLRTAAPKVSSDRSRACVSGARR